MKPLAIALIFAFALASAHAAPAAPAAHAAHADPGTVTVGAGTVPAGEIRTAALSRAEHAPHVTAYGQVVDPVLIAALGAELAAARSAVTADQAKARLAAGAEQRSIDLYRAEHNISKSALEDAQSAAAVATAELTTASARLAALQTKIRSDWGTHLAAAIANRSGPVPGLESGSLLLVQVSLPMGQALPTPPAAAAAAAPDGTRLVLHLLGRSPRVAAGWAGQSLFYLGNAQASVAIGTPLTVSLDTNAARPGLMVPKSAVVWRNGGSVIYRALAGNAFAPIPVRLLPEDGARYFLPQDQAGPLVPGSRIVVQGAALLLSAGTTGKPQPKRDDP
jgi:hypothetical protein